MSSEYIGVPVLVSGGKIDVVAIYHLGRKRLTTAVTIAMSRVDKRMNFRQRTSVLKKNNIA
jgi:hypothetical protein